MAFNLRKLLSYLLCMPVLFLWWSNVVALEIQGARYFQDEQKGRMVLELTENTRYSVSELTQPARLVIDLPSTDLTTNLDELTVDNTLITGIRYGNHGKFFRLVVDLSQSVSFTHFMLSPTEQYGYRLVIDLLKPATGWTQTVVQQALPVTKLSPPKSAPIFSQVPSKSLSQPSSQSSTQTQPAWQSQASWQSQPYSTVTTSQSPSSSSQSATPKIAKMMQKQYSAQRDIVVVIDAGHGGKDSGAHGPTGTHEKMVVLSIARQLKELFDNRPGFKAVLTRDGDYYISLRERLNIARQAKADLFISVHADAFRNANSRGASVYAVSEHGASSEAAHWLAKKENYSELGHVNLDDKTDRLREVLINLSQAMTIAESLSIGNHLLGQFKSFAQLHHESVEQAPFVVLKSPDIPSVLVETGFISNPLEESRLKDPGYQQRLAQAIHNGVINYFKENPPDDYHHVPVLQAVETKPTTKPSRTKKFFR